MTKSDLKTRMLIECRNGDVYLIINDIGINKETWFSLYDQNEDLTFSSHDFDIVRVSKVLSPHQLQPKYWNKDTITKNLLWEEKPVETIEIGGIKYSKKEVEDRLKDLKPIK